METDPPGSGLKSPRMAKSIYLVSHMIRSSIYMYIIRESPLALHFAGEPGIDQAWSGPCDHAPLLPQPTAPLWWSGGAVHPRVAAALSSQLLLCRTLGCSCSATPLPSLLLFIFVGWVVAAHCVWVCQTWRTSRLPGAVGHHKK